MSQIKCMSCPYHVEFLTWNTGLNRAQGLTTGVDAMAKGYNLGHAAVEISLPYSTTTQQWVELYCKNIQLHKPKKPRFKNDSYVANIPVYYTTTTGKRVSNPKSYSQEHPQEQIVTHVYVSWVPGDYAAQRDDRDPFMSAGKRSFGLYDRNQDKIMEYEGNDVPFIRGYQGLQRFELIEKEHTTASELINRGVREIYRMTPMQVKLAQMTPKQKLLTKLMAEEIYDHLNSRENPKDYLNRFIDFLNDLPQAEKLVEHEDEISLHYDLLDDMEDFLIQTYCHDKNKDYDDLDEDEENECYHDITIAQLKTCLVNCLECVDLVETLRINERIEFFRPIQDEMTQLQDNLLLFEKISETFQDFSLLDEKIKTIQHSILRTKEKLKKAMEKRQGNLSSLRQEIKALQMRLEKTQKIRFEKAIEVHEVTKESFEKHFFIQTIFSHYCDSFDIKDTFQSRKKFLEKNLLRVASRYTDALKEEIKERDHEQRLAMEADMRVILPIANIEEANFNEGHPEGLNVLEMLKAIPKVVGDGQGYALHYKNCSDVAQELGKAGAPDHLKTVFDRHALGMQVTPQVVANGATHYAQILYDVDYQPGAHKPPFFDKFYQKMELAAAKNHKQYQILSERIEEQDHWVQSIANNLDKIKERFASGTKSEFLCDELYRKLAASQWYDSFMSENAIKQAMQKRYGKYHEKTALSQDEDINRQFDEKKGAVYKAAIRVQIEGLAFAYANQEYAKALAEDRQRIYRDIDTQSGLFASVSKLDPNPLAEQAIKDELRHQVKSSKSVKKAFIEKGDLYRQACHRIIYRHAPGTENLMDPDFVSIEQDRKTHKEMRNATATRVIQLILFRSLYAMFKNPQNVESVWFEVNSARKAMAYGINKLPDGAQKTFAQAMRIISLAAIATVHGVFIAPRRIASKWFKNIRTIFAPSKKSLAKHSHEQSFLDAAFSKKRTVDKKTQQNINHYQKVTEALIGQGNNKAVKINEKRTDEALRHAKRMLDQQKIPYFDRKIEHKLLKEITKVEAVLSNAERKADTLFSSQLNHRLDQFEKIAKIKLGRVEIVDFSQTFNYLSEKHGPVIPKDIQETQDVNMIRNFFKKRISEYREAKILDSEDEEVPLIAKGIDFLTSKDIDQMSDKQLFEVVRRMTRMDYVTQLKMHEKQLLVELAKNPQVTPLEFTPEQLDEFKAYLKDNGWDSSLLDILESKDTLPNLLTRLQYAQISDLSVEAIVALANEQYPEEAPSFAQRVKPITTQHSVNQEEPDSASAQQQPEVEKPLDIGPSQSSAHRPKS